MRSIKQLAHAIAIPPMLGLLGFAGILVNERIERLSEATKIERKTEATKAVGEFVHRLQRERGTTAWHAAVGAGDTDAMMAARRDVDTSLVGMLAAMPKSELDFVSIPPNGSPVKLSEVASRLADLRARIDAGALDGESGFQKYNDLVGVGIDLISETARDGTALSLRTGDALANYRAVAIAKEFAGRERAMGAVSLSRPMITMIDTGRIAVLAGMHRSALQGVRGDASDPTLRELREFRSSPVTAKLDSLRRNFMTNAGSPPRITPEEWFAAATAEVDALYTIEQHAAARTMAFANLDRSDALFELVMMGLASTLIAIGAFVVAARTAQSMTEPLSRLTAATKALAGGDLTAPTMAEGPTEIRATGEALEVFRQSLWANQQMSRELADASRMASLGAVAASIAHEVNTPIGNALMVTSSLAESVKQFRSELARGQIRRSSIDACMQQADEATNLIQSNLLRAAQQIRSFKQMAVDQTSNMRRSFDLKATVDDSVRSCLPVVREANVEVDVDIAEGIMVESSPGGLSQVIINLLENAIRHGFAGRSSGHVAIVGTITDSDHVRLAFSDNGVGIPEALVSKVFGAFFTTRANSGGSGLGLHIVQTIVKTQLGGSIELKAGPEGGAQFVITFPRIGPANDSSNHSAHTEEVPRAA